MTAVFLDRDGVLNRAIVRDGKPYPPETAEELEIVPEASECLQALKRLGHALIVVTNQPDIARGKQDRAAVDRIHERLRAALPIDEVLICPHDDADRCGCRKPSPGMILEAARRFGLDLAECFLIGDRWRDIEAGQAAGCRTVWIDYGYREKRPSVPPDATVHALRDAVKWISNRGEDMGVRPVADLRVKIFADGADLPAMLDLYRNPWIAGFTTNPTLMRKAGVTDYCAFAREVLSAIPDRPISFEVFADEFTEMEAQAREIASWGENVYVKVPITNTKAEPALDLLCRLSHSGVKVNATAILAPGQVRDAVAALAGGAPAYISIFAGRIADTGRDPVPIMASAVKTASQSPNIEVIWASPRELLNVFQADSTGCHIITATADILKKLSLIGKDLDEYSLETVQMFYEDAVRSQFALEHTAAVRAAA